MFDLIVRWLMNYSLLLQFGWAWLIDMSVGVPLQAATARKNIGNHFYKACLQNTYKSDTQSSSQTGSMPDE